ncbi:MAG TPA: hypothetical protein VNA14_12145 [Mycobacteriales bacterium]|nr:hypothetical protein [Mycobacteriales bacterium]
MNEDPPAVRRTSRTQSQEQPMRGPTAVAVLVLLAAIVLAFGVQVLRTP